AEHENRKDMSSAQPVAEQAAGHLKEAIGYQEGRRQVAHVLVVEPEAFLDGRCRARKAEPLDIRHHRQDTGKGQHLVTHAAWRAQRTFRWAGGDLLGRNSEFFHPTSLGLLTEAD